MSLPVRLITKVWCAEMDNPTLTLCEELLLLTIDDHKGAISSSAQDALNYGLAGAILADLALHGKIQLDERRLVIIESAPTGQPMLDDALVLLAEAKHPRKAAHWIEKLSSMKLQKRVISLLLEKGVLCEQEKRYLWVIPYSVYPQQDASAKYWVKNQLRSVVMANEKAEGRVLILLSLLKACRLLNLVFTKDERKAAEKHIEALVKGEEFGEAVFATLESIEEAAVQALILMGA
jgi:golgi phosphoprotein 3